MVVVAIYPYIIVLIVVITTIITILISGGSRYFIGGGGLGVEGHEMRQNAKGTVGSFGG